MTTTRGQITAAIGPGKYGARTAERPTGRPVREFLRAGPHVRPSKPARLGGATQLPSLPAGQRSPSR